MSLPIKDFKLRIKVPSLKTMPTVENLTNIQLVSENKMLKAHIKCLKAQVKFSKFDHQKYRDQIKDLKETIS